MAEALGLPDAAALFEPLRDASRLLIAVSGGPDSVALMRLAGLVRDAGRLPPALSVATVDHGLTAGSEAIARDVVLQAEALGLDAHLLTWSGPKPRTGIQAAARRARYALLVDLAHRLGAGHVVTAHTLDDQAETILFRMARGSGPAGLIGMRPRVERDGIALCRPLLGVPKARLVATCRAAGWPFVEDPANRDPRFARSRLRSLLPLLAAEGLDAPTLAGLGARLARDETALREAAERCRAACLLGASGTHQRYLAARLLDAPAAVVLRVLDAALTGFARAGPPRLLRLEALVDALAAAFGRSEPLGRTLHGVRITLGRDGVLEMVPEPPRRRGTGAHHPS